MLTPERAIPDQYIVVFDDAQATRTQVAAEAQALARQHGGILHTYQGGLRGFAASMSATAAAVIARSPRIRYVEQDSVMTIVASQPNATGASIASISAICRSTAPTPTTPVR